MRGLVGECLKRFENAGLKIIGMKMMKHVETKHQVESACIRGDIQKVLSLVAKVRNITVPGLRHFDHLG